MPSYKCKDGTYKSYCKPISKEFYNDVMKKYEPSTEKLREKHGVAFKVRKGEDESVIYDKVYKVVLSGAGR